MNRVRGRSCRWLPVSVFLTPQPRPGSWWASPFPLSPLPSLSESCGHALKTKVRVCLHVCASGLGSCNWSPILPTPLPPSGWQPPAQHNRRPGRAQGSRAQAGPRATRACNPIKRPELKPTGLRQTTHRAGLATDRQTDTAGERQRPSRQSSPAHPKENTESEKNPASHGTVTAAYHRHLRHLKERRQRRGGRKKRKKELKK